MLVRLGQELPKISLRGVDYPAVDRVVNIPDDYLEDLLLAVPGSEPLVWNPGNEPPKTPSDDGRNKV